MDSITHTIIAVGLLAVAFYVGKWAGKREGIEGVLSYLINYGACTEDDIERANDRFSDEHDR